MQDNFTVVVVQEETHQRSEGHPSESLPTFTAVIPVFVGQRSAWLNLAFKLTSSLTITLKTE